MPKTINLVFKAALIICCYMNYKDAKPYSSFSKIFSQQREPVEKEAVKKNHRSVKLIDIVTVILWFPAHTSSQYSAGKSSNVILYYTSLGCFNEGRFLVICLSVLKIVVRQSEFKAENMNSLIKHLNHWYWIDEGDFASKRTFTFLMLLFLMMESEDSERPPWWNSACASRLGWCLAVSPVPIEISRCCCNHWELSNLLRKRLRLDRNQLTFFKEMCIACELLGKPRWWLGF